jgi:hypothetical protein
MGPMGLISRKPGQKQETGEPAADGEADGADRVEVTIEGPDSERLGGLIDMSAVAAMLARRAAEADRPPKS